MTAPGTGCGDDLRTRALSERLRVVAVRGERLHLAADRAAGCAACAARKSCGAAALNEGARVETIEIARPPGLAVRPGDEVEVSLEGNDFLAAASLAYLLPALGVVLAAAAGLAFDLPDIWVALACLAALGVALIPLARAERHEDFRTAFRVEAVYPAASLSGLQSAAGRSPTCGT